MSAPLCENDTCGNVATVVIPTNPDPVLVCEKCRGDAVGGADFRIEEEGGFVFARPLTARAQAHAQVEAYGTMRQTGKVERFGVTDKDIDRLHNCGFVIEVPDISEIEITEVSDFLS